MSDEKDNERMCPHCEKVAARLFADALLDAMKHVRRPMPFPPLPKQEPENPEDDGA